MNSTANIASAKVIANIVALKAGGVKYYIVHSNGALTTSTITAAALTPVSTVGALSTVVEYVLSVTLSLLLCSLFPSAPTTSFWM